jgi:hypothetical protein
MNAGSGPGAAVGRVADGDKRKSVAGWPPDARLLTNPPPGTSPGDPRIGAGRLNRVIGYSG